MADLKQYDWGELNRRAGWPAYADDLERAIAENPELVSDVELDSVAELEARVAALEAAKVAEPVVDPRDYGAQCDGITDDTAAWHALTADVLGAPTLMEGGKVFIPGPSVVSDTIEFRKFSGELFGAGWGRGAGAFVWDGPADIPVLRFRECQGAWLHDFRVTGTNDESRLPSALVEMFNWLGDPDPVLGRDAWSQAHNKLERLWLGRHAHEGTRDELTQNGLVWTGNNVNNDHNTIIDCKIMHGTGAAIRQEGSQNILNKYIGGVFTDFEVGMDTNATVTMDNPDFARMRTADVVMRQGQKLHVKQWHSEHSNSFLHMLNGGHVIVEQGTWQCFGEAKQSGWGGMAIDASSDSTAEIQLRNILFGISTLTAQEVADWRIDLGAGGKKYLTMDGVQIDYGPNSLDESNFNVALAGDGYRLIQGHFKGRASSFRNVLDNAGDTLSFTRFDGAA